MLVNEFSGSGGDAMPWLFRYAKVGELVGTRSWGGLVGISGYPALMDGGTVTSPSFGFFSPAGKWEIENHGVAPDVEVDMDPKEVAEGHDPQLERAVAIAMAELKKNPPPQPHKPPYPNYNHEITAGVRSASAGTDE
jgi:tricorn protease